MSALKVTTWTQLSLHKAVVSDSQLVKRYGHTLWYNRNVTCLDWELLKKHTQLRGQVRTIWKRQSIDRRVSRFAHSLQWSMGPLGPVDWIVFENFPLFLCSSVYKYWHLAVYKPFLDLNWKECSTDHAAFVHYISNDSL